jgi:hypothetical protein
MLGCCVAAKVYPNFTLPPTFPCNFLPKGMELVNRDKLRESRSFVAHQHISCLAKQVQKA